MKRKNKEQSDRFKTVRKRTVNGVVVSRLVENRKTGDRRFSCDINKVCNR